MIENGKKYEANDLIEICAQDKLYYKYTRYDREDHTTEKSFVFYDELQPLLDSIDSEMERHCWDDWEISWKRSGLSLKITVKEVYATMWLSISVVTEEQMNAIEALVLKKKDWNRSDCQCEDCVNNCKQCHNCRCCCTCDKSQSDSDNE